jgi:ABC-2 type transport system ATP-binding protein
MQVGTFPQVSEPVLETRGLIKRYGRVHALSGASFTVPARSITAFLGENGAGKTTAIKTILGFLRPDSGQVLTRAPRIGYVPERPAFFPWLRGRDVISLTAGACRFCPADLERNVGVLADRIGFEAGLLDRRVPGYSPGNQKKLAYLQNLLLSPDFLIVDEPFSSLDPLAIRSVRNLMAEFRAKGGTVLLSSHLIGELERICDRFIILQRGRVVVEDSLESLRKNYLFVRLPPDSPWPEIPDGVNRAASPFWMRNSTQGRLALVEKSTARRLAVATGRSGGLAFELPTLESLYFFFTY